MKKIIFALLLCLFATNVFCAEKEDGRWWLKLDNPSKNCYLIGFSSGLVKGAVKVAAYKDMPFEETEDILQMPSGYNIREFREILDHFYSNPQYRKIEVCDMLVYIVQPALYYSWGLEKTNEEILKLLKTLK